MAPRQDRDQAGLRSPSERGRGCTRLRRARRPAPQPRGPPWPPSRPGLLQVGRSSVCSCSRRDCECSHVPDLGGGMRSSRMSHSFLPVFQLFEAPRISRQAGVSPPESDQLLHFASNGQLCGGTKPQPHCSVVTGLLLGQSHSHTAQWLPGCFWETHTGDLLGLPLCGQLVRRGPRGCGTGPRIIQTRLISVFLLFSNRCPNKRSAQLLPNMRSRKL